MKYIKFEIKNYKGIEEISLDLTKLPNANIFTLVGLNESGKTSILEAINLLHNNISTNRAHEMIHKSKKGNFNGIISVSAVLKLDENDEKEIKEYCAVKSDEESRFILTKNVGEITYTKAYEFKDSMCDGSSPKSKWEISLFGKRGKATKENELYTKDYIK